VRDRKNSNEKFNKTRTRRFSIHIHTNTYGERVSRPCINKASVIIITIIIITNKRFDVTRESRREGGGERRGKSTS